MDERTWMSRSGNQASADAGDVGHDLDDQQPAYGWPIPRDANRLHESEIENHVKHMVNDEKALVYYRVEVEHATEQNTNVRPVRYPSALDCRWYQLDVDGEKVDNTECKRRIEIKKPSEYNTGQTTPKTVAEDVNSTQLTSATARTKFGYDEVLLDDPETLQRQRLVMAPLIETLRDMGLHPQSIHGDLKLSVEGAVAAVRPSSTETGALEQIEALSEEIASSVSGVAPGAHLNSARASPHVGPRRGGSAPYRRARGRRQGPPTALPALQAGEIRRALAGVLEHDLTVIKAVV